VRRGAVLRSVCACSCLSDVPWLVLGSVVALSCRVLRSFGRLFRASYLSSRACRACRIRLADSRRAFAVSSRRCSVWSGAVSCGRAGPCGRSDLGSGVRSVRSGVLRCGARFSAVSLTMLWEDDLAFLLWTAARVLGFRLLGVLRCSSVCLWVHGWTGRRCSRLGRVSFSSCGIARARSCALVVASCVRSRVAVALFDPLPGRRAGRSRARVVRGVGCACAG